MDPLGLDLGLLTKAPRKAKIPSTLASYCLHAGKHRGLRLASDATVGNGRIVSEPESVGGSDNHQFLTSRCPMTSQSATPSVLMSACGT